MRVVSAREQDLGADLRRQVVALQRQAWPSDRSIDGPTHDPALRPVTMALLDGGRVVAALDILSTVIDHSGERFAVSGLSTVVTDEDLRGRGYGGHLVNAARVAIETSDADLGIFTCDVPLVRFYERSGWEALRGSVLIGGTPDNPFPSDQFEKVTMARFFSLHAIEHAPAFVGARIELFPGSIDKLW